MSKCPLCGSEHVHVIEKISKKEICDVYKKEYDIDVSDDIPFSFYLRHCHSCDLKYFDPCYTGSQKFYTDLQKFDWYYKSDKYEYDYVLPFIKSRHSVLEIGCGRGTFSKKLKTKRYVGLEYSENAKELAAQDGIDIRNESIAYHAMTLKKPYDVVVSFQVLEHVCDPKEFIMSALACLKPGGLLILTVPSEDSWLQHKQDFSLNMPPHHVTKWTDRCLTNIANEFNIKHIHLHHEPLNSYHIPWYLNSMLVHQLNKTLGVKQSLIKKLIHAPSHFIANIIGKMIGNDCPNAFRANGHTVVSIYKK
jgi:2-polyprenyl-3-methyl-5-hydroxy-6-metoxy-1,4-benzoquinol methylase